MDSPEGRASYLKKAIVLLAQVESRIDRMVYVSDTAKLCGMTPAEIEKAVEERRRYNSKTAQKQERQEIINPGRNSQTVRELNLSPEDKAQRGIIAFMLHSPDYLKRVEERITAEHFPTELYKKMYSIIANRIKNGDSLDISSIGDEFSAEEVGRITGIISENNLLPYQKERLYEYITVLEKYHDKYFGKKPEEMTDSELLEQMEKLRKEKTKKT